MRITQRRNLNYFLLLLCVAFCLSACIKVNITCDNCESENIGIIILTVETQEVIVEAQLKGCGTHSISIPSSYVGKLAYIAANCDEDNNGTWSIGDYMAFSDFFVLDPGAEIPINIKRKITGSISGEVSCAEHDTGLIWVSVTDIPCGGETPCKIIGTAKPFDLNDKSSYFLFLYDVPIGSEVYVGGFWDKDQSGRVSPCDYVGGIVDEEGKPIPIEITQPIMTGINFDACLFQFPPCAE